MEFSDVLVTKKWFEGHEKTLQSAPKLRFVNIHFQEVELVRQFWNFLQTCTELVELELRDVSCQNKVELFLSEGKDYRFPNVRCLFFAAVPSCGFFQFDYYMQTLSNIFPNVETLNLGAFACNEDEARCFVPSIFKGNWRSSVKSLNFQNVSSNAQNPELLTSGPSVNNALRKVYLCSFMFPRSDTMRLAWAKALRSAAKRVEYRSERYTESLELAMIGCIMHPNDSMKHQIVWLENRIWAIFYLTCRWTLLSRIPEGCVRLPGDLARLVRECLIQL